ncbi:MAG TPA: S1-like domain-containing RNA-binding protein [Lacibacter sp.]|nr:S1-like domain-containing RNA-binding protein [Lacibacter sp.]HMO90433.1 S1-like domain-containing RNA-binding protein [Lacibacter sp.]HMP86058.1 S1-like domain-containing RNA-binding protein [Lacibacter sp.]
MIQAGNYNRLQVQRLKEAGAYLDDGASGILLPKRFVPRGTRVGDELTVFVYHDSEDRLIATTQHPRAVVGDIALLKVVGNSPHGAFLDWGLMKDLFVPKSKQRTPMRLGGEYLVYLYVDAQTGRVAASQYIEHLLSNEPLTVKEKEVVELLVYRETEIGYEMIINNRHTGLLHFNEVYRPLRTGDRVEGYIKTIRPDHKIDLTLGRPGYTRVEDEAGKILRQLEKNNGFLPYHDKSGADAIYEEFGMSKKAFKMAVGKLYKERIIELVNGGIRLAANGGSQAV